jgi:hypothetical protein
MTSTHGEAPADSGAAAAPLGETWEIAALFHRRTKDVRPTTSTFRPSDEIEP